MFLPQRSLRRRPAFTVSIAAHAAFGAALVGPPLFALPPAPEWEGIVRIPSLVIADNGRRVTVDLPSNEKKGSAAASPQRASGGPARPTRPVQPREIGGVLPEPRADADDDSFTFEETGERSEPLLEGDGRGNETIPGGGPGGCEGCNVISASTPGVTSPVALDAPSPAYPELARRAHVEGVVVLEAVIGSDGLVRDARVLRSSSPLLEAAALEAVRRWRYEPARIGARRVPVYLSVVVTFALRNL